VCLSKPFDGNSQAANKTYGSAEHCRWASIPMDHPLRLATSSRGRRDQLANWTGIVKKISAGPIPFGNLPLMSSNEWTVAPVLGVTDVEKSVDYFCDSLGFHCDRATAVYGGTDGAVYAVLQQGSISVHLQIRRGPVLAEPRGRTDTDAYFYVPDSDALYVQYKLKSVRILREIENSSYGLRDFMIETPDGHRLVFGSDA
jgi:catechol 2,3-dioxygenase-like lactoylglutathione lyase family enzyme